MQDAQLTLQFKHCLLHLAMCAPNTTTKKHVPPSDGGKRVRKQSRAAAQSPTDRGLLIADVDEQHQNTFLYCGWKKEMGSLWEVPSTVKIATD
jgi:hypothetical protein